jgi:hypothetical protein
MALVPILITLNLSDINSKFNTVTTFAIVDFINYVSYIIFKYVFCISVSNDSLVIVAKLTGTWNSLYGPTLLYRTAKIL